MTGSITGLKGLHHAPALKEQPVPEKGEFAGKAVTVGGALKTIGRVALGVVTLGISELVIRLAQRKPPEVVPTAGPGRAARTLTPAQAGAAGPDRVPAMPPPMSQEEIAAWHEDILRTALGWRYDLYSSTAEKNIAKNISEGKIDPSIPARLTEPELVAIVAYTHTAYKPMNAQLRAGGEMQANDAAIATVLDTALAKLPPFEGDVHRGAQLDKAQDRAKYARGNEVTEPCYTSTSAYFGKAFDGNTQWTIMSKTGRDISFCSAFPEEQEVLFSCDTRFKSLHCEPIGNQTLVVMKQLVE